MAIIDDATTYNIDYNLNSNNCTDFVIDTASLCGMGLPAGMTRNNDGGNASQNNGDCN